MVLNFLTSSANDSGNNTGTLIMMIVLIAIIVVFMIFSRRRQQKQAEETKNMLDAIQPGNKVKTIGGICGVVVEVCPEDNTFIMETGSEKSGKSYLKFDKQAVYQTDAVAKKEEAAPAKEKKEKVEETPFEEVQTPTVEEPAVEETTEEKTEE